MRALSPIGKRNRKSLVSTLFRFPTYWQKCAGTRLRVWGFKKSFEWAHPQPCPIPGTFFSLPSKLGCQQVFGKTMVKTNFNSGAYVFLVSYCYGSFVHSSFSFCPFFFIQHEFAWQKVRQPYLPPRVRKPVSQFNQTNLFSRVRDSVCFILNIIILAKKTAAQLLASQSSSDFVVSSRANGSRHPL